MQENIHFLNQQDFIEYISKEKFELLENLPMIAKDSNLSSKHLYKKFQGIFAQGDIALLKKPKVAIVGTRTPNQYAKHYTAVLSKELSSKGFVIVSGGAIGIDSIAHQHSSHNSIMILPSSIEINYPKENSFLIDSIRKQGLVLSEYESDFMPRKHNFLERNRIIIAMSDIVIIPQADLRSGSSSSANLARVLQKPLFVLPHRLNESLGTQELLLNNHAKGIYCIESFVAQICKAFLQESLIIEEKDALIEFAKQHRFFDEALEKFGNQVLEYELAGKIRRNGVYIELC